MAQNVRRRQQLDSPASLGRHQADRRVARGPRSLLLHRSEHGFGFTLRHFIVYPPESYTMLGGDKLGVSGGEPMDTIFVKSVREKSPAHIAGLATGDRIISVNNQTIGGQSYAQVVQLIQQSGGVLQLLVVPKEDDILQRYFGETAHNPETNRRPAMRAPCEDRARRGSSVSSNCDGDSLRSYDSGSTLTNQDEESSQRYLSRLRKSFEQKEEFLRRPATSQAIIAREFYARPQKLQRPVWPPQARQPSPPRGPDKPAVLRRVRSDVDTVDRDCVSPRVEVERHGSEPPRPFVSTLTRIHENFADSVSHRARQFESPGDATPDRTVLYRSELSRLQARRGVPEVSRRRREFEQRQGRESRSLESAEPPEGAPVVKLRARSNSAESWAAAVGGSPRGGGCEQWPLLLEEETPRHKAVRQDSYLAAVKTPVSSDRKSRLLKRQATLPLDQHQPISEDDQSLPPDDTPLPLPQTPVRPNQLTIPHPLRPASPPTPGQLEEPTVNGTSPVPARVASEGSTVANVPVVLRRQKASLQSVTSEADDDRLVRRVSYLKATWGDRMHVDSDFDLIDPDSLLPQHRSSLGEPAGLRPDSSNKENLGQRCEGWLHCKFTVVDNKRATDRSWKQVWAMVRGAQLYLYKDRRDVHTQTPLNTEPAECQAVELRGSQVDVAGDYTKKKHVLRLNTLSCSELLLQAEHAADMARWIGALGDQAGSREDAGGGKLAANSRLSPLPAHKGIRKLTSFRNRSPTGQSPVTKTRKPSQTDQLPSPKNKTWKGRVAKQLRRIQQGAGSPSSPTAHHPEGVTIGIPLEECPQSIFSEFVPLLVELCTGIVEERGLDYIGIYRVPGNTAAVSSLTEVVNKGLDTLNMQDPRWHDVNVISSLLKLFFRRLPDSLLTMELYPSFIQADKLEEPARRITAIRKLIHELPDHHYETLRFLLMHLKRVVEHSVHNKMEARNLAIVFGPTLVRAGDDNMVTMVTDMSHQCRIVESLISHVDWFFSSDDSEDNFPFTLAAVEPGEPDPPANHSLLLGNIHKVEGMRTDISAKDIVSSIISAANRKIQKGRARRGGGAEGPRDCLGQLAHQPQMSEGPLEIAPSEPPPEDISCGQDPPIPTAATEPLASRAEEGDEVTIRTYAGLSATTQERIRRFERETKAMLQRDQTRQRREAERHEADKLRIDRELRQARRDLESEDLLDSLADNPCGEWTRQARTRPAGLSRRGEERGLVVTEAAAEVPGKAARPASTFLPLHRLGPPETTASCPSYSPSLGVQATDEPPCQKPAPPANGTLKRLKTGREQGETLLGAVRCGSLDSLQEAFGPDGRDRPQSDVSDDGSDLLASLTSTLDRKLRSLRGSQTAEQRGRAAGGSRPIPVVFRDPSLHRAGSASPQLELGTGSEFAKSGGRDDAGFVSLRHLDLRKPRPDAPLGPSSPSSVAKASRSPDAPRDCLKVELAPLKSPECLRGEPGKLLKDGGKTEDPGRRVSATAEAGGAAKTCAGSSPLKSAGVVPGKEDCVVVKTGRGSGGDVVPRVLVTPDLPAVPSPKSDVPSSRSPSCHNDESKAPRVPKSPTPGVTLRAPDNRGLPLAAGLHRMSLGSEPLPDKAGHRASLGNGTRHSDSVTKADAASRNTVRRSESLTKADTASRNTVRRSESLTKADTPTHNTVRRSDSLTKADSASRNAVRRSDSLTKTEKTECNLSRRESGRRAQQQESLASILSRLKRKNGMPERSIKRRHTVGGTKDLDKMHWLDNRDREERKKTSSPDLSSSRPDNSEIKAPLESHI